MYVCVCVYVCMYVGSSLHQHYSINLKEGGAYLA